MSPRVTAPMRKLLMTICAAADLTAKALAAAAYAGEPAPDGVFEDGSVVLFIGDSITHGGRGKDMNHYLGHGYQAEIAARYLGYRPEKRLCFLNRGVSGDDTPRLLARWEKDVFGLKFAENGWRSPFPNKGGVLKPDVVSLMAGINDFHRGKKDKTLTAEKYAANLETLVTNTLSRLPGVEMVVCEPFTLHAPDMEAFAPWRAAAKGVAERHGLCFVDFQTLFSETLLKENPQAGYWFWDRAHPTYAAHIRMADYWIEKVAEHRRRQ